MKKKTVIWISVVAVVLAAAVCVGLLFVNARKRSAEAFDARISGTWVRQTEENWYTELEIGEGEMCYKFFSPDYPEYNEILQNYYYQIVGENTLKISPDGETFGTFTVTFGEDSLTFSPALTGSEQSETRYRK